MAAFQQLGPFISTFAETEEKISENEDSSCLQDSSCLLSESANGGDASKTSPRLTAQVDAVKENGEKAIEGEVVVALQ